MKSGKKFPLRAEEEVLTKKDVKHIQPSQVKILTTKTPFLRFTVGYSLQHQNVLGGFQGYPFHLLENTPSRFVSR